MSNELRDVSEEFFDADAWREISPTAVARIGRPSAYSPDLALELCEIIADSDLSIRELCRTDDRFPNRATINRWVAQHEEFAWLYQLTIEGRLEDIAFEAMKIADDGDRDMKLEVTEDGASVVLDKEHIARTQQRLEWRKWLVTHLGAKRAAPKAAAPAAGDESVAKDGSGARVINHEPAKPEDHPLWQSLVEYRKQAVLPPK